MDNGFESLGADAELDQVIFDGSSFGTATPAGSDEEADYLGIPGLLDADADARPVAAQARRAARPKRTASGEVPRPSTHGQLRELRRELNALVSIAHHRTGKPHGWIHNELRRVCGGPPIAAATTDQLKARIEAVRSLQALSHIRHMRYAAACAVQIVYPGARHGELGQVLQRVVQVLRVERRELDVLAHLRRHRSTSRRSA